VHHVLSISNESSTYQLYIYFNKFVIVKSGVKLIVNILCIYIFVNGHW